MCMLVICCHAKTVGPIGTIFDMMVGLDGNQLGSFKIIDRLPVLLTICQLVWLQGLYLADNLPLADSKW